MIWFTAGRMKSANDTRLRQRRVHHALRPELVAQPLRRAEDAAPLDILAEDEDALIALHLLLETVADRLQDGLDCHGGTLSLSVMRTED
jgi:hypothetical protein